MLRTAMSRVNLKYCFGKTSVFIPSRINSFIQNRFFSVSSQELASAYSKISQYDDSKLLSRITRTFPLSSPKEIFANTELNLGEIDVIGFDYDYTLAAYSQKLQELIYREGCEYLIKRSQYPMELANFRYDPNFVIRGLCYDKENGFMAKLDSSNRIDINWVYQGRQRISKEKALQIIGTHQVSDEYRKRNMVPILDLFALAELCLLGDICELLIHKQIPYHPGAVYDDVNTAIRYVHKSGKMHDAVMKNIEEYVIPSPQLEQLLIKIRKSNKSTFLLSNSRFEYIDAGLKYLIGPSWRELFDFVCCSAAKPNFYSGKTLFRKLEYKHNQWRTSWKAVDSLELGSVYIRGNLQDLLRLTQWQNGKVLYIGDNLRADLVEPAKSYGWYTGAIIKELEDEISCQSTEEFQALNVRYQILEEVMRRVQWTNSENKWEVLNRLEQERTNLQERINALYKNCFGSVFSSQYGAMTIFANSVNQHVDLYTSHLENFVRYDDSYRFYPRKRGLPHEIPVRLSVLTELLSSTLSRDINLADIGLYTREE